MKRYNDNLQSRLYLLHSIKGTQKKGNPKKKLHDNCHWQMAERCFFSSKIFNHKNLCLLFFKNNKGFQNLKPFIGTVGATGFEPVTPCL